jgi:AraC-like DNA-binding protein
MWIPLSPSPRLDEDGRLGTAHAILSQTAHRHYWSGGGALSIKTFFGGAALYESQGHYRVDDGHYLVLNQGQTYSVAIDSPTPIESFCVFFADGFAAEVRRCLRARAGQLLDDPAGPPAGQVDFFQRTYAHDGWLSPALQQLRARIPRRKDEPGWLEEQFHRVMQRLLLAHGLIYAREVETLPAVRAATREELYRRLHRARDYAAACFDQPLTLEAMAAVACLSPNHFLRTFKSVFRQTPHQYLTARRLEQARRLLRQTDLAITDICYAVGFQSLGSFSWLFRRRVGVSPQVYRQQKS